MDNSQGLPGSKQSSPEGKIKLIVDSFGKDRFTFDEEIKNYTASEVGGPAKLFFVAFTTSELTKIISICRQLKLLFFVFGTGSKIMISDNGFNGLIIKNRTKNISVVSVKGKATRYGIGVDEAMVEVDGGVSIPKLIEFLNAQGLETAEFKGIVGSIGGNLFLNFILQRRAKSIKVYTLEGEIEDIRPEDLSIKKHIILSAVFQIKAKG